MKRRFLLLLPALLAVTSCGNTCVIRNIKDGAYIEGGLFTSDKIEGYHVGYLWDTSFDKQGRPVAKPYFGMVDPHSKLGRGFQNVMLPKTLIGGDYLMFWYSGTIRTQESYPGTIVLDGTITKYTYQRTSVKEFTKTSSQSWVDIADYQMWSGINNENVILDEEGHFVPLSEYSGNKLYATNAAGLAKATVCRTPDCHELGFVIGALYAYEPNTELIV